ncbi:MAG: efflux RND transporter permease subunit [Sandaracinaceae bacterium]|nr:efflux RND transporter permease subunit [Sandaracinaceae bacterium]
MGARADLRGRPRARRSSRHGARAGPRRGGSRAGGDAGRGPAHVLLADFRSPRLATLVFASLPFALVGGIVVTALGGGIVSLGTLIGLVTVLGIASRNGILLVSHYRHLEEQEGMRFGVELILRGTRERLAPILMTALATGLALVPLVVRGNAAGHEIEHPMAVVILGGLASSTLLNLIVMPVLYLLFGRARPSPDTPPADARTK